jgi:hypothetical protein
MFDTNQKPAGTTFTMTVAFLVMAILFFGYTPMSVALAISSICLALAGVDWKTTTRLAIPSMMRKER